MEFKSKGWFALLLAALCLWAIPAVAWAQTYSYSVYVDADARASTGCAEGPVAGAEVRLEVTASGGLTPQVVQVTRARCESGLFGANSVIAGSYPVGTDNGSAGSDVIELADEFSQLAGNASPSLIFSIVATSAAGQDFLLSTDGSAGGPPIALGLPAVAIPLLGLPALILMAVLLGLVGARVSRRRNLWRVIALLSMLSGVAVAANFIVDGQVGDWNGVSALANDPAGDASSGESAIDLRAFFAAIENDRVYMRIDVTNLENNGPVAVAGSATTLEDQPVTVNLSGTDNENDPLTFAIVGAPVNGTLGAIVPTGPQTATVQYTPNADANGSDSFSFTVDDGQVISAPANVALTVTPVNDVPAFTAGADQSVLEDAGAQSVNPWATAISAGPANESGQALDFIVSNDNNALFSAQPSVSASGVLTYTPAADANGTAVVTLSLHDDGGTTNGGVDTSPTQTFTITVTSVNDTPVFTAGPDVSVPENAPAQTINPWATAISAGAANEAGQVLAFTVSNDNNALFSVQPAVSPTGVLTFTPVATLNGSATVTLTLGDDGGTANGGIDTSAAQTFTISVVGVNDPPSFTVGADQTVTEDAGTQTVDPWATAILPGPPNESTQTVSFSITGNTNTGLFSAGPSVSPTGVLSYTPAANASGNATITLVAVDNGGTANGGTDTSPPQSFQITATAVNDAPVLDLNGPAAGTDFAATYTEGNPAVAIVDAAALTVIDIDNATLASATVAIGNLLDGTAESLAANTGGTAIVAGYNGVTGILTLTGPDTLANFQTVLRTLAYLNTSTAPNETARLINAVVNDGSIDSNIAVSSVSVVGVNTIPSFTGGPPVAINEDAGAQSIANWATAINDNDGGLQTLNFTVTQTGGTLTFSTAPAVSATGTLTFTTAADASGSATFDVVLTDSGSNNNTSAAQTLSISATAVNDVPSFTVGADENILENAGPQTVNPWATALSAGPADEAAQTLSFNITGNDNPALFSAGPSVSPSGVLTYTTAADVSGIANITLTLSDNGGTANGGIDTSVAQSFSITVNNVNSAPVFSAGPNQTVNEDAGPQSVNPWATGIDDGDPTITQVLTFNVTGNTNPGLFSAAPAISAAGVLTYTPAADVSGTATITVVLTDDGGTASGGVDTSAPQTFDITVNPVNDAPTFTPGANPVANEDAGPQSAPWATAINAGASDESGQTLSFNVTANTNPGLFSAGPAVSPTGVLSFTPTANTSGTATLTVVLSDNGGTANGGVDTSTPQNVTITVNGINDAPSFTVGPNQTVNEDSGAQSIDPWISVLDDGDPEATQALTFTITGNDNAALFSAGPTVSATGVLTFTPAPEQSGVANISLRLSDDGGTANGGVDTSGIQNFSITVLPVNDPPVATPKAHDTHSAIELEIVAASHTGELLEGASDIDDPVAELSAQLVAGSALPTGAVVTLVNSSDGSFRYDPPGGYSGPGSFQFQICDDGAPTAPQQCSAPTTVTFDITGPELYFVDDNAAAGGDGGLNDPFDSLADIPGARGNGDRIYVYSGTYATAHTLNANEHLIGQGHTGSSSIHLGVVAVSNGVLDTTPPAGTAPNVSTITFGGNDGLLRGVTINSGANPGVSAGAVTGLTVLESSVASGATAVNFNGTGASAAGIAFTSTSSTAGVNGIVLNNLTTAGGVFDFGNGALSGHSGVSFLGTGTLATVNYAGTINKTSDGNLVEISGAATGTVTLAGNLGCSSACDGIDVLNRGAGIITFSGGTQTLSTGASTAVNLDNNDAVQILFTGGGLDIDTTTGTGFNAVNGATAVTVQGAANTIDSVSATALNVANSTIGAGGLSFLSINTGTAGIGPANGIVLDSTGTAAGLTVSGSGGAGSGGTIRTVANRGASFINASNISLSSMNFTNTAIAAGAPCGSAAVAGANTGCNAAIHLHGVTTVALNNLNINASGQQGINGIDVSGFSLNNSTLTSLGNGPDEDGLHFHNLVGINAIANTSITGSGDDNVNIQNLSPTASTITFTGGSYNAGVLGSGLLFGSRVAANTTITITGAILDNNFSGGVVADGFDNATLILNLANSTIANNNDGVQVSANNGISRFDIDNNSFVGNDFLAVTLLKAAFSTTGILEGAVRNNPINVANGRTTDAVMAFQAGAGALRAAITNNNIIYAGTQRAILIQAGQDGSGTLETTVTGNVIDMQLDGTGNAVTGILAQTAITGPGNTSALCFDAGGAGSLSNQFTHSLGGGMAGGDVRVRQRNDGTVRLPGYAGGALDTAAVQAYLGARNTLVSPATATAASTGFAGGAACTTPIIP